MVTTSYGRAPTFLDALESPRVQDASAPGRTPQRRAELLRCPGECAAVLMDWSSRATSAAPVAPPW
jgi:hypothetical protein